MMIQQTSLMAYQQIISLSEKQLMVYKFLCDKPFGCNNRIIAEKLGKPINTITPRVNELVKRGLVEEHHKGVDQKTKKLTIYWSIK